MDLEIPEPPAAGESEAQQPTRQAAVSEPAAPPAAAEPASATAASAEQWVVQVGSFGQQLNASGLRQRLEKAGYHSYLQEIKVDGSPAWRVLVGPYGNREQAERQRERLSREQQLKGLVTRDQG
jgi:DedD protein